MHPFGVGISHRRPWTHLTHHGPDLGEATTFPHIVFFALLHRALAQVVLCPGTPKVESRNYPDLGLPGLWAIITSRPDLRLGRGLNQSCSSPRELSKSMSHSPIARRNRVDSRLFVLGSQTGNLTPNPSFAHNFSCRCPNDSCEAILDISISRPFQWHQEHFNERCFDPCNQALSFRESRRTPSPQLWECEFHPHTWPKWGCDREAMMFEHVHEKPSCLLGRGTFLGGNKMCHLVKSIHHHHDRIKSLWWWQTHHEIHGHTFPQPFKNG